MVRQRGQQSQSLQQNENGDHYQQNAHCVKHDCDHKVRRSIHKQSFLIHREIQTLFWHVRDTGQLTDSFVVGFFKSSSRQAFLRTIFSRNQSRLSEGIVSALRPYNS
ncbi:MAG: hypothetical protein HC866_23485 [Leptolyngbyaceae cyanobacterium RU_5_1]|nr:hypothetical protein [Leptolyngbyaceae cyanobacterium RU_5_1]